MAQGTCSIDGCDTDTIFARGWCRVHWNQWRRYGDPLIKLRDPDNPGARFWPRVDKTGTCWNWTGQIIGGYGRFWVREKNWLAHRFVFVLIGQDLPSDMEVDHRCHNKRCVNPDHLRLTTHKENRENHNGPTRISRSGIRGVHWQRNEQRWRVTVTHNDIRHHGGTFTDLKKAEQAAIALRNRLHTHNDRDRAAS